jgi:nudix-type nucleoside diphosphatase (YffH/AdpP family)
MKVEIHQKRRVFDGFFKIDQAELQYQKFDGTMSPVVTRLNFDRGDSAAAVVLNVDTRKVIMVNQFKYPAYEKGPGWITEVVAGMIDGDETPEAAMRREILEEIGYETHHLEHISTFYVSPGGTSERIVLFYAEVANSGRRGDGGGLAAEGEDIKLVELSLAEVREMLASKAIEDAKTIIGLNWLQNRWTEGA